MGKFFQGQVVALKSDPTVRGAVIGIVEGMPETRYQVFTTNGIQNFFDTQLVAADMEETLEQVDAEYFHAELTASLIRNPSISSLYSLNAAKIDFIPHQFRPVLKFIRSDRPRLLIADGVGVGKTIEAGLILRELQARRNLDSILIICPRPLVAERKWEEEMKRFNEEFTPLDGEKFRYCIQEMDMEGEWPDKYKRCIIPYSLFDEGNVFGSNNGRKNRLGLLNIEPPKFDLVIVDEAHHIRNTATYGYKAVNRFCDAAEAVVFLTATPVQLEYDDLFVLLNLLRPDLIIDKNTFYDMAQPNNDINHAAALIRRSPEEWQKDADEAIVRACETSWGKKVFAKNPIINNIRQSLKQEEISPEERVKLIADVENLHTFSNIISRTRRRDIGEFTIRKPITVNIDFTEQQRELHDAILEFIHELLSTIHCTDNTKFMMTTIRRQTASCLFGLVPMLQEILARHVIELIDDEILEADALAEELSSSEARMRMEKILDMAEKLPPVDPKFDALIKILEEKQLDEKKKVMIFSSFKHTLNYLNEKLRASGYRVGLIHGGVDDETRRALRKRFNPKETPNEAEDAIDVLMFSEVGCEGLDYQFCDCMINYDLPWNPMRVEQRIGRIDRNGQTSEHVSIYNLITLGTVDADIYERCLLRIGVFRSSIGDCEEILGELTSEIKKIAENLQITEDERRQKIQQMTDNKVRLIKEQEALEEKQRDLFGVHMPSSAFDKELERATNFWLSADKLQDLVHCYLRSRLGADKEYIWGEKRLKNLRLSQEARVALLEDYRAAKLMRSETNRLWEKWLKSDEQYLPITFDSTFSKENPNVCLITITHPLIKQATLHFRENKKTVTSLTVNTDKYNAGIYPFAIYQWKLSGVREDLQMIPVSTDSGLNKLLLELLKKSVQGKAIISDDKKAWDMIETLHHQMWEQALSVHQKKTEELILYKESSLKTSHQARLVMLKEQLMKSDDNRYRKMTEGKIRIAIQDYEEHMEQLLAARKKADILFEPLAYGQLLIQQP